MKYFLIGMDEENKTPYNINERLTNILKINYLLHQLFIDTKRVEKTKEKQYNKH